MKELLLVATVVLVLLKVLGIIAWPWLWCLVPLIVSAIVYIVLPLVKSLL